MAPYVVKRVLFSLLVLGVISIIVFSAVRVIPGDVCHVVLQTPDVTEAQCKVINGELGIDQPVVTQYFKYMGGVLKGDFGRSLITKRDVFTEMKDRIPLTIELTLLSTIFALLLAIPIGVISAIKQDTAWDYVLRFITIGWLSIPAFWLGTMLIVFPSTWWNYGPPVGYVNERWRNSMPP